MTTLVLPLKSEYFDAIRDGTKPKEYRLVNDYWSKRLIGRSFTQIVLTKGYPKADDSERHLTRAWRGYEIETITHSHFGPDAVTVFAIDVTEPSVGADNEVGKAK